MRSKGINICFYICCCMAVLVSLQGCAKHATVVEYAELKASIENNEDMVLIDVRPPADFKAGHLQNAINIDLSTFANTDGSLINNGEALTLVLTDKSKKIVAYCFGYGNDKIFADAAIGLGYTNVYRYAGGTTDWSEQGDYFVIDYDAFKTWHDAKYPFDNSENYLIDDLPVAWYTGDDPSHPGGHIPGAINLPVEQWAGTGGVLVNNGTAFSSVVTNKDAMVVIYCGNAACGKSLAGVQAAVAMGYKHVYRYQGGWQEWQDKGNPLTPGDQP
jgi:rhodanese-related sulfurtransferase